MPAAPAPTVVFLNPAVLGPGATGPRRHRLVAIRAALDAAGIPGLELRAPRPAIRPELERVHAPRYLDALERIRGAAPAVYDVRDILPGSMQEILLAAGAGVEGVDLLLAGAARAVFCAMEPPGHHAERARGMGFCAVDNAAISVRHALARGVERVLLLDWDVHHGNGSAEAFAGDPRVAFVDLHQRGLFPGTGDGEPPAPGAPGLQLDVALPPGSGNADYAHVLRELVWPLGARFRPELVVVSSGFDAHRDDPLGGMEVTSAGFAWMCWAVAQVARRHASGRLLLHLEGGYHAEAVGQCVARCVRVLAGTRPGAVRGPPSPEVRDVVARHRARLDAWTAPG